MLFRLKPVTIALCLLTGSLMSISVFADDTTATSSTDTTTKKGILKDAMTKIAEQSEALEEQMIQLQKIMLEVQTKQKALQAQQLDLLKQVNDKLPAQQKVRPVKVKAEPAQPTLEAESKELDPSVRTAGQAQPAQIVEQEPVIIDEENDTLTGIPYGYTVLNNIGGTAVVTAPFINSNYSFGGSGLITNFSSIDKDVAVLRQRADFYKQMTAMGLTMPGYPLLEISGQLNVQANGTNQFNGDFTNDFNLTAAEVDFQALVNPWFTGFISYVFNTGTPSGGGNRVTNAGVFLDNGFITIGNLTKSPFYATAGQIYVPFGQFDSYLITNTVTKTLFRTLARPVLFGYAEENDGPYASVYVFRDDTMPGRLSPTGEILSSGKNYNTWGGDIGYMYRSGDFWSQVGISYISNVADSLGMQFTGAPDTQFQGFGTSGAAELLRHDVPGVDLVAEFSYKQFMIIAEYAAATRPFNPLNLSYNGEGAKPEAFHIEGIYSFDAYERPSSVVIGFDQSSEALALNVPRHRASIALNTSIWRNTLASLEYRHDTNYGDDTIASGNLSPIFNPVGSVSNAVTAQFNIYF